MPARVVPVVTEEMRTIFGDGKVEEDGRQVVGSGLRREEVSHDLKNGLDRAHLVVVEILVLALI